MPSSYSGSPNRFGRDMTQASPLANDLWLAGFGGQVLSRFSPLLVADKIVKMIPINVGEKLEFPMLGDIQIARRAPGEYVGGSEVPTGKRVITLDERPLYGMIELDSIDKLRAHFQVEADHAKRLGEKLASEMDKNSFQLGILASRTAADAGSSVFNGGGYNVDPTAALTGAAHTKSGSNYATDTANTLPDTAIANWGKNHALTLMDMAKDIAIAWDQRDVPQEGRSLVVPVSAWYALKSLGIPTDKATTGTITGFNPFDANSVQPATGINSGRMEVLKLLGFDIFMTNNLPKDNVTEGENKYLGDFRKVRALAIQQEAVGMMLQMGLNMDAWFDKRTRTDCIFAETLYGGGTLRPECAVEIAIS